MLLYVAEDPSGAVPVTLTADVDVTVYVTVFPTVAGSLIVNTADVTALALPSFTARALSVQVAEIVTVPPLATVVVVDAVGSVPSVV